jgi:type VI secretion system protein ImpG
MKEYFENEMRLLTSAAQEFAERYPEEAGMLNLNSLHDRDPYVERLLEGFAFLTAQIRQKIDDDIPEISENLLQQLWPQILTPLPAMTIMQFNPDAEKIKVPTQISKGTLINTSPVGDKNLNPCTFRTTSDLTVNPLQIIKVNLTEATAGGSLLQIDFKANDVSINKLDLKNLRIYLNGDLQIATHLHFMLTSQVQNVKLSYTNKFKIESFNNFGSEIIQPCMLTTEEILNPNSGKSFFGFNLLQEYFAFREKYFFLAIHGLDKIDWSDSGFGFSLLIQTKINFPNNFHVTKDNFCLHCVPAINLFEKPAEPIMFDNKHLKYRLIADSHYPESNVIHSIKQFNTKADSGFSCNVTRQNDAVYVSLNNKLGIAPGSLSFDVIVCNGNHPYRYIAERQVHQSPKVHNGLQIINLTRPTPMYLPKNPDFCWSLLSHLSLNYTSLSSIENLQNLLNTYNWTENSSNINRIKSIIKVTVTPITNIRHGAIMQGVEFNLTVREVLFSSIADLHLFGLVLHNFFSMYVWLNFFVITKIICDPSGKELVWQPIYGSHYMI